MEILQLETVVVFLKHFIGVVLLVTTFVAKNCLGDAYGVYFDIALMLLHLCVLGNGILLCRVWNIVFPFETLFMFIQCHTFKR